MGSELLSWWNIQHIYSVSRHDGYRPMAEQFRCTTPGGQLETFTIGMKAAELLDRRHCRSYDQSWRAAWSNLLLLYLPQSGAGSSVG